jgi:hypothetical protein
MTDDLARHCTRAVHVLTPSGAILSAGRASLCVLSLVGYSRLAKVLSIPPLIWFVELSYWIVARNRRFFGRFLFRGELPQGSCPTQSPPRNHQSD